MPFDNPHELPFGDLEILRTARSHISNKGSWMKCGFQNGNRLCLVAALSVAAGSANFDDPNRIERRLARILVARLPPTAPLLTRFRVYPVRRRLMLSTTTTNASRRRARSVRSRNRSSRPQDDRVRLRLSGDH